MRWSKLLHPHTGGCFFNSRAVQKYSVCAFYFYDLQMLILLHADVLSCTVLSVKSKLYALYLPCNTIRFLKECVV